MKLKLVLLFFAFIYSMTSLIAQNKYIDSSISSSKTYTEKHLLDNASNKVNKGIDNLFSGNAFKKKNKTPQRDSSVAASATANTVNKGKTQIVVSNTNYQALASLTDALKTNVQVTDVAKSFADGIGTLQVTHSCSSDQLLDDLVKKAGDKFEVSGIENGKITLKMK